MDEIEKLFRKLSPKEREQLLTYANQLQNDGSGFSVKKLKGSDFYRARKGRWRFIFHYESKKIVIDNIRLRNEKTYRDV